MEKRLPFLDFLRGIAIIGVISIHSSEIGLRPSNTNIEFVITIVWRQMVNFSVPLFLAISGYLLAKKKIENKADYWAFLKKQLPRVLVPYVVWSFIYLVPKLVKGASIQHVVYEFVTFQSSAPFYFILLICQYYVLLPFLLKIVSLSGLVMSAAISFISCFIILYLRNYTAIDIPLVIYGGLFTTWLVFFILGMYLREYDMPLTKLQLIIVIVISFLLSLFDTYWQYMQYGNILKGVIAIKASSFLYSIFVISFLFRFIKREFRNLPFVYMGVVSFGIYLSHPFAILIVNKILAHFFVKPFSTILYQVILITVVVGMCLALAVITRSINKRIAMTYLGQ